MENIPLIKLEGGSIPPIDIVLENVTTGNNGTIYGVKLSVVIDGVKRLFDTMSCMDHDLHEFLEEHIPGYNIDFLTYVIYNVYIENRLVAEYSPNSSVDVFKTIFSNTK